MGGKGKVGKRERKGGGRVGELGRSGLPGAVEIALFLLFFGFALAHTPTCRLESVGRILFQPFLLAGLCPSWSFSTTWVGSST